jgi:PAS domain S-box-containing protein
LLLKPEPDDYRFLIENLPDAFAYNQIVLDDRGTPVDYIFIEVNQAYEEMTGLKREAIIGKNATEIYPDINTSEFNWLGTYGRVALTSEPTRFVRFYKPFRCWYDISVYSDKPGYFAVSLRNINEQKKIEQDLRESEEKHRRLFETMAQGVVYHAADGKIISANPAAEKILGLSFEQMQGKTTMDPRWQMIEEDGTAVTGTDHPSMIALRTGQTVGPVTRGVFHPDKNSYIWLSITAIPLFQPGEEKPFQVYAAFTDITERRQAEEDLRITQLTVDKSPLSVFWISPEGKFIYVNEMATKKLGYSSDELLSMYVWDVDPNYPQEKRKEQWNLHRQAEERSVESDHKRRDGTTFPVRINIYHLAFGDKEMEVAEAEDITESKQAEDEIRTMNEKLEERVRERTSQLEASNRELDAFSYSVSHDLRGPLNRIDGFSQALLEDYAAQLDHQGQDYLRRISNSSRQMTELIDDLLKLSKVSQMEINHETVEISALVNVCLKELRAREPQRNIEIVVTPNLIVEGDTALLRIVLENLIDNAWKYTRQAGKARIEFGITETNCQRAYYIRDNGVGFDMKYAAKLFIAFQRLHSEQEFSGTGIGLSIVSRIIKRHGGKVWAEGEPGKGACFYFTLP